MLRKLHPQLLFADGLGVKARFNKVMCVSCIIDKTAFFQFFYGIRNLSFRKITLIKPVLYFSHRAIL